MCYYQQSLVGSPAIQLSVLETHILAPVSSRLLQQVWKKFFRKNVKSSAICNPQKKKRGGGRRNLWWCLLKGRYSAPIQVGSGAGEQRKPSCINFLSSTTLARTVTYCTDVSLLKALLLCTFEQEHWRYLMLHAFIIYPFHAMKLHRKRPPAKLQPNVFKESILRVSSLLP